MIALYTDGTPVQPGDKIRYRQQPGGLLPAGDWKEGIAALFPHTPEAVERIRKYNESHGGETLLDPDELHLQREEPVGGYSTATRTAYYHIAGHIVERAA